MVMRFCEEISIKLAIQAHVTYANLRIVQVCIQHDDRESKNIDGVLTLDLRYNSPSALQWSVEAAKHSPGPEAK